MNIKEIRRMGPGTDVHNILERLAYRFWEKGGGSAEGNWFLAEERFEEYSKRFRYMDTPEGLHQHISDVAHFIRAETQDERLRKALDREAEYAFNTPCVDAILMSLQPLGKTEGYRPLL